MSRTLRKKSKEQVFSEKENKTHHSNKRSKRHKTKNRLRQLDYDKLDEVDEEDLLYGDN